MAPEKDYIDSAGLETLWAQVVANFVSALGVSGNNLTWVKDGMTTSITIPYATKALKDSNGLQIDTGYLKLTGGTIDSGSRAPLTIKGVSSGARIGLTLDGETIRYIGINESGQPIYASTSSTPKLIWHDGDTNHSTLDLSVKNLSAAGTLTVAGASTLASLGVTNNATIGGTLGVTGKISGHSDIEADGGVAALGIADLSNVSDDKMPKYIVQNQTAEGSNITLMRYYDAPTYQAVEFSGSSGLRISNTIPTGEQAYTGYPRYMRIHNATSGTRQIAINFTCVTDKKSITLDSGKYVELMFFETDNYMTAKWSEIMTNQ